MSNPTHRALLNSLLLAAGALVVVHIVGTVGFLVFDASRGGRASAFDAFYMTFITVATIGYAETIDLSGSMPGRLFNVGIAICGIGAVWVMFSNFTALLLARAMDPARMRARLLKEVKRMQGHYIICGLGRIGAGVAHELEATGHACVAIEPLQATADAYHQNRDDGGKARLRVIIDDATDDQVLLAAGLEHAAGVFAVTGDDSKNVLISLSAKQLNPKARVVARVHAVANVAKCRRAGADEIVSPDFSGALRLAGAMLQPQAAGFMDELLHRGDAMRVVDVLVPDGFQMRPIGDLPLRGREYLVVGLRSQGRLQVNPEPDMLLSPGTALIAMATPTGAAELRRLLLRAAADDAEAAATAPRS
ncbi:MAG: potassium channel protein [Rubrivivax sp.]|nr:potassium channel protein [Rubrivivax sp.]